MATQGANDNASGVAALLELGAVVHGDRARPLHHLPVHQRRRLRRARGAALRGGAPDRRPVRRDRACARWRRATPRASASTAGAPRAKVAPPWLWLLTAPAARVNANMEALLPTVPAQVLRLAVPTSSGSQGPFRRARRPGHHRLGGGRRSAAAERHPRQRLHGDAHQGRQHGAGDDHGDRRHDEPGAAQRRHDLPHAQPDAARRLSRPDPRRVSPAARRRDRRPVRALPPGARQAPPRGGALGAAPGALARAAGHRLSRQPAGPAAPQPGRRHPARVPRGRQPALPARGQSSSPCSSWPTATRWPSSDASSDAWPPTRERRSSSPTPSSCWSPCSRCSSTPTPCCSCCPPPSSGPWRSPAAGRARSCRPTWD